jgi:hypothetical protein
MMSGHNFYTTLTLNQVTPLLVIAIACSVILLLHRFLKKYLLRFGFKAENLELDVIEDLPNFYECVNDGNWLVDESQYYWHKYALRLIPSTLHRRLEKNKANVRMTGECWYNILANEKYA